MCVFQILCESTSEVSFLVQILLRVVLNIISIIHHTMSVTFDAAVIEFAVVAL